MDDIDHTQRDKDVFRPPRPMGLMSEKKTLLEGQMAREDLLDYLVRVQNANHIGRHPRRGGLWRKPTMKEKKVEQKTLWERP